MKPAELIADQPQRAAAIDPCRSFIVQAPAGSGKTELLIQRFLALLGKVERPQQILAITFTRKAAGELRSRLLEALEEAGGECPQAAHKQQTWALARQALAQDRRQHWELLQNPTLLSVQTIDSFNAGLVRKMPWLSRFGGVPELAEDADSLYLQAAENLLARLGSGQPGDEQVALLLAHLDNRMEHLQQMLVGMLRNRDQWLRHLLGVSGGDSRGLLENGLVRLVEDRLVELVALTPAALREELLFCGRYAAGQLWEQGARPLLALTDLEWWPRAEVAHLPLWQGLADLLLTAAGQLRKPRGLTVKCGFPAGSQGLAAKQRMQTLLSELESRPELVLALARCRNLPEARYAPEQWRILQALIELLPLLVGELWLVFRSEGQSDFAEVALKAREALRSAEDPSELLLKLDSLVGHILVDEFQDTSWLQYQLLETLTAGWQEGDGRTLFLVGDPMQSIYRFREAEVGLFLRTFGGRLGNSGVLLEPLRLTSNFRSQQGIVRWVNNSFACIFPDRVDAASGAVPLAAAEALLPELETPACRLYPFNGRADRAEAETVLRLIETARAEDPQQILAILVRSRTHLPELLRRLRHQGLRYQAQDIDLLGEQPVALDILALTRALLHRADRLAWLSVLRAPWAALSLDDLHALVVAAPYATLPSLLQDQARLLALSAQGQQQLARIVPILQAGLSKRGGLGLRALVEGCWLALGGPACYDQEGVQNAALVFDLLESLEEGGDLATPELLEQGLAKLFAAPDTEADGRLQVMTIHKAKGLEFDQVIIPGLGRKPRGDDSPLLRWLEHPDYGLLLAPIAPRDGSEQDPIYQLIGRLEREKQELETARLLYVAATRAKKRLHLLGHARENGQGILKPEPGSLLETLWPVVEEQFGAAAGKAEATAAAPLALPLRRLPVGWRPPQLSVASWPKLAAVARASDAERSEPGELLYSGWENQEQRHIGTMVHNLLEQLVKQGVASWRLVPAEQRQLSIVRQLGSLGVPATEQEGALQTILAALDRTLKSARGRWILAEHAESDCELALTGLLAGQLIHAVIDRTFVDEQGIRWVIDYKVSRPKAGESGPAFFSNKLEQYRGQLESYRQLLQILEPGRTIRAALYFPLLDGWCELEKTQ
jgi:ATP-dependent exoDNAse (exonuclease V) beta subunit